MPDGSTKSFDATGGLGSLEFGASLSGTSIASKGPIGRWSRWPTDRLSSWTGAAVEGLAAGWRAAADYRRLSGTTAQRLEAQRLSRSEIPRVLFQRHFARLRSPQDIPRH